jgi:hypothetical protein
MNRNRSIADALIAFDHRWNQEMAKQKVVSTCSKGCSACCSEPVYTSKAEARLALSKLPGVSLPWVTGQTRSWLATAQASGILDNPEPHVMDYLAVGLPGPFLKDKLCLVYKYRPLGCRSHCATLPAEFCSTARLQQRYARSPELLAKAGQAIFAASPTGDHLGVWLARLLLQAPVQSAAHVSVDRLWAAQHVS